MGLKRIPIESLLFLVLFVLNYLPLYCLIKDYYCIQYFGEFYGYTFNYLLFNFMMLVLPINDFI
jgi:hypothetical protein